MGMPRRVAWPKGSSHRARLGLSRSLPWLWRQRAPQKGTRKSSEPDANWMTRQLFLSKNAYVNGEILAVDGGVLNVVSGR